MESAELLFWIQKWVAVNNGLVNFACGSHTLFPFLPRACKCSLASSSNSSCQHANEVQRATEAMDELRQKESISSSDVGVADSYSVPELCVLVHTMLSCYAKVECWPLCVVVQHLLASSVEAWIQQLCVCSGGRLHAPTAGVAVTFEDLSPPQLSWAQKEVGEVWAQALAANHSSWARLAAFMPNDAVVGSRRCGCLVGLATTVGNPTAGDGVGSNEDGSRNCEQEDDSQPDCGVETEFLYTLVGVVSHFCRMKWVLSVVFLRLNTEKSNVVWRILRSYMHATLERNRDPIVGVMCRVASRYVTGGVVQPHAMLVDTPRRGRLWQEEVMDRSPFGAYQRESDELHERCAYSIFCLPFVFSVLDECGALNIALLVTEHIVRQCYKLGGALAGELLGPLCSTGDVKSVDSNCGAKAETLDDVSRVLDKCMMKLDQLRAALLMYFGGGPSASKLSSDSSSGRVKNAVTSFLVGFTGGESFINFVTLWALPLWLHACEDECSRRHVVGKGGVSWDEGVEAQRRSRLVAVGCQPPVDEGCVFKQFPKSPQRGETGGTSTDAEEDGDCCVVAPGVTNQAGFVTLLYFLTPETASLLAIEEILSDSVKYHLECLLNCTEGKTRTRFCALPHAVYQRCIFLLKLTTKLLDPLVSEGCWGASAVLRAMKKGLQAFFTPREPSVILAVAGALNAQVIGKRQCARKLIDNVSKTSCRGGAEDCAAHTDCDYDLEVLDTILKLASILRSRDLFIDCYCGLLAPRLMRAKHMGDLQVDIEVISRMAVWLGESVVAQPQALLRDIRCSVVNLSHTTRLPIGETPQVQGLSCHVRVLCGARWDKYAPIPIKLKEMRSMLDGDGWFDAAMVWAADSFETLYEASALDVPHGNPVRKAHSRGAWNTAFFASLGQEEVDGSGDAPSSSANRCGPQFDLAGAEKRTSQLTQQRRTLSWSLGSGTLTIMCAGYPMDSGDKKGFESVQLVAPPIALLVLQALQRHSPKIPEANSFTHPLSFDELHRTLPVEVPKPLLGAILGGLVRHHIVLRAHGGVGRCADSVSEKDGAVNTYAVARSFVGRRRRKAFLDPSDTSHHWVFLTGEHDLQSGTHQALCDNVEDDRKKRLEVNVIRILKAKDYISHTELCATVRELLQAHFTVTSTMIKQCISDLINRDFIARDGTDTYIYLP